MAEFKSDIININSNINTVYSKLSNPESLKVMANDMPAEVQEKLEKVVFSGDSITFQVAPVGDMTITIVERVEPKLIALTPSASPVPFKISINLDSTGETTTTAFVVIDVELNPFIKPMVQGPLNDAVKKFGELLSMIPYDKL